MIARIVMIGIFLGSLGFSGRARAGDLEEAQRWFQELRYEKAMQVLEKVLRSPGSGPRELAFAFRLQGLCLSAVGKSDEAFLAFRQMLAIDANMAVGDQYSPKLVAPFFQAQAAIKDKKPITLALCPIQEQPGTRRVILCATLDADPWMMVQSVRLRYGTGARGGERVLAAGTTRPTTLNFALADEGIPAEYLVEALNDNGGVLAAIRSSDAPAGTALGAGLGPKPWESPNSGARLGDGPFGVTAQKAELLRRPTPWYKTWWFWTAVGVVAAGATAGTVLLMQSGDSGGPVHYQIVVK